MLQYEVTLTLVWATIPWAIIAWLYLEAGRRYWQVMLIQAASIKTSLEPMAEATRSGHISGRKWAVMILAWLPISAAGHLVGLWLSLRDRRHRAAGTIPPRSRFDLL